MYCIDFFTFKKSISLVYKNRLICKIYDSFKKSENTKKKPIIFFYPGYDIPIVEQWKQHNSFV